MNNFIYLSEKNQLVNLDNVNKIEFIHTAKTSARLHFDEPEVAYVGGRDLELLARTLRFDLEAVAKRTRELHQAG